jgi:MoaA/NifB/PqqE/SkfB family radical SAM enzyme
MAARAASGGRDPRGVRFGAWQIELTTRCPLSCRMCIRQGPDEWRNRDLDLARLERLVPELAGVDAVVLQGWGEPLLHPRLLDAVRLVKGAAAAGAGGKGPAAGFVTSGKGLDARCADALVEAGLDFLGFSVAGARPATHAAVRVRSSLDEVVAAAEHVLAAKRRRGARGPRVHAVFLALRDNVAELPELPALARRMGAEELVVTNLVHVVDRWQDEQKVFGAGAGAYEGILAETERRARECGVALRRPSLSAAPVAVCEEDPLRNLYVTVDGEVAPCVYLGPPLAGDFTRWFGGREHRVPRVTFGDAWREGVRAAWDSPAYAAFRARFALRARRARLRALLPWGWRSRRGAAEGEALPAPPDPCRTCHKLLGA